MPKPDRPIKARHVLNVSAKTAAPVQLQNAQPLTTTKMEMKYWSNMTETIS